MPCVPDIGPNGLDTLDVDDTYVESRLIAGGAEGLVPLMLDLGLVMQKDRVAVHLQPHGMALEIEVKLC